MFAIAFLFVRALCDCFKSRRLLEAEVLVLRHQLNVLQQRAPHRLYLTWIDRALFVWLYRGYPRILDAITILRPETIVRWHRKGFAAFWRWKSRPLGGRPQIDKEVRDLIRRMSFENPRSGVRRICDGLVPGRERRRQGCYDQVAHSFGGSLESAYRPDAQRKDGDENQFQGFSRAGRHYQKLLGEHVAQLSAL